MQKITCELFFTKQPSFAVNKGMLEDVRLLCNSNF